MFVSLSTVQILPASPTPVNHVLRWLAAVVCAGGAGVHAALVPDHLRESPLLGSAFVVDALLLGVAAVLLSDPGRAARVIRPAAGLLAGTALAYLLSRTTGLPPIVPGTEPVDGLGVLTTLCELAGAAACLLANPGRKRP